MYRRTYGFMPRNFSGFFEDVLQNGYNIVKDELNAFAAPVNIIETDKSYELQVSAPGLKKENFKINVEKQVLHISYDHKEDGQQEGKVLRSEFSPKSFKRSFTLNEKINSSGISAKYTDGVLHISMAKKEESAPQTQDISVN